ncbi:MAG: LysR family transcriptional regulator [Clostridiales Family XIII bacterium]|nr:LysR family transcriptional regulator [Clostridiales Family XIII bacterium]
MIYFLAVVDYQSFSQAAFEQNIAQSSLSKHIQGLEDEFHVKLFNRNKHMLSLTEAGTVFAKYAEQLVQEYNTLRNRMDDYAESGKLSLRIISVPVLQMYDMSTLIAQFKNVSPEIRITLIEAPQPTVINEMNRQNVDLAIVRSNLFPKKDHYEIFPLCEDELTMVCNPRHPLAQRDEISIREISDLPLILLRPGIYDYETGLKQLGLEINLDRNAIQLHNIFTLAEYLRDTDSVTFLMGAMADMICADGTLVKIPFTEHPPFPLAVVARRQGTTRVAKQFVEFALRFYADRPDRSGN